MTDPVYVCEWGGPSLADPRRNGCKNVAAGYVGPKRPWKGSEGQHPLCAEHLDPKWHPPGVTPRKGPVTHPCMHAQPMAEAEATGGEEGDG